MVVGVGQNQHQSSNRGNAAFNNCIATRYVAAGNANVYSIGSTEGISSWAFSSSFAPCNCELQTTMYYITYFTSLCCTTL